MAHQPLWQYVICNQIQDGQSFRSMHVRGTVHSFICFLGECEKPVDIHRRKYRQQGNTCVALWQVQEWQRKIKSGVSNLADAALLWLPHAANTPHTNTEVEQAIWENQQETINEVLENWRSVMAQHTISFTKCCSTIKSPSGEYQNISPLIWNNVMRMFVKLLKCYKHCGNYLCYKVFSITSVHFMFIKKKYFG